MIFDINFVGSIAIGALAIACLACAAIVRNHLKTKVKDTKPEDKKEI